MPWSHKRVKCKAASDEKQKKEQMRVLVKVFRYIKYGKWSDLTGHFIKHKPLISKEWFVLVCSTLLTSLIFDR